MLLWLTSVVLVNQCRHVSCFGRPMCFWLTNVATAYQCVSIQTSLTFRLQFFQILMASVRFRAYDFRRQTNFLKNLSLSDLFVTSLPLHIHFSPLKAQERLQLAGCFFLGIQSLLLDAKFIANFTTKQGTYST